MALHPDFPESPHEIIDPSVRWLPADETLRDTDYGKLLPPLVHEISKEVVFHDVACIEVKPHIHYPLTRGWIFSRMIR
jgi:hypothetical protein